MSIERTASRARSWQTIFRLLLGWAVLLPLISFFVILIFGPKMGKGGSLAGWVATLAIVGAGVLSFASLVDLVERQPARRCGARGPWKWRSR